MSAWIPALTTTALLGLALFFAKKLILTRLTRSVAHEFDVKLERVRAEINSEQDRLGAARSAALATMTSGVATLHQRRLDAIDRVWASTIAMGRGSVLVSLWANINLDQLYAHRNDEGTQRLVKFFETQVDNFLAGFKPEESALRARPYVTPMAWALCSAYSGVVTMAMMSVKAVALGVPLDILKENSALVIVREALPDRADVLDKLGNQALPMLLPEISDRLLAELRASLEGRDSDPRNTERAKRITDAVAAQEAQRIKIEAGL